MFSSPLDSLSCCSYHQRRGRRSSSLGAFMVRSLYRVMVGLEGLAWRWGCNIGISCDEVLCLLRVEQARLCMMTLARVASANFKPSRSYALARR